MLPYLNDPKLMGNPSSLHALGRRAADRLSLYHDLVADIFKAKHDDVVFNSGGSEGATHALLGTALMHGKPLHIAVSAIEHKCVLHAAERLQSLGHRLTVIPVDGNGVVPLEAVESLLADDTPDLVSVMAVNNEVGTIQPVREIAALCLEHDALFHSDMVQVVGHGMGGLITDPAIPLLTCSAHKFGGPRGMGILVQRGIRLPAFICGGLQEHGCRAGTENIAGVAGMVAALKLAEKSGSEATKILALRQALESGLAEMYPGCIVHGSASTRSCHVTSVAIPGITARSMLRKLDRKGYAVGLGSACTGCSTKVSHVLEAMGVPGKLAESTLRFSLGWKSTEDDVVGLLEVLGRVV